MLTDLAWASAARAAAAQRARPAAVLAAARDRVLEHDRRAAVAAPGRDPLRRRIRGQPAGAPRAVAAPARAAQAAPGAAAAAVEPRRAGRGAEVAREASSRAGPARSRSSLRGGRRRSGTSPRSPTPPTPPRRASTACSRRGSACAASSRRMPPASWSSPAHRASSSEGPGSSSTAWRGCASSARWPPSTTARWCGARGCSCARRAARTTGSPSSRRWPTAACSSAPPRPVPYAALPIARALDARLVGEDLARACVRRCSIRHPTTPSRARAALAPFAPRGARQRVAERATSATAWLASPAPARGGCWRPARSSATRDARWPRPSACSRSVRVRWASESITISTPARAAARAWMSDRSRRSGLALISSIVPVRAAAANTASRSIAYGSRRSISRPVGWPIASTSGCSIAAIIRSVIACSLMPNEVCTLAITQSSSPSSSSS